MKEKSLADSLNEWVSKNNIKEIEFRFSNNSTLFDDESIKNMKLVYFYINKKKEAKKEDNDLKTSISNHIIESWEIAKKEREKLREELEKSGKKTKELKYEITPDMLRLRSGTYFVPKRSCNCHVACDCNYR